MIRLEDLLIKSQQHQQKSSEDKKSDVYGIPKGTFVNVGNEKRPISEKLCQQYYFLAKIFLLELESRGIATTIESCFNVLWDDKNKPNLSAIEEDLKHELTFLSLRREEIINALNANKNNVSTQ